MSLNSYCADVWRQLDQVTLDCWHNLYLANISQNYRGDDWSLIDGYYVQPQVLGYDDWKSWDFTIRNMPYGAPAMVVGWLNWPNNPSSVYGIFGDQAAGTDGVLDWTTWSVPNERKTKVRRSHYTGIVARRRNLPA